MHGALRLCACAAAYGGLALLPLLPASRALAPALAPPPAPAPLPPPPPPALAPPGRSASRERLDFFL